MIYEVKKMGIIIKTKKARTFIDKLGLVIAVLSLLTSILKLLSLFITIRARKKRELNETSS